jgi:hypothetical protein
MSFKLPTPFALVVAAGLLAGCEPAADTAKPVTPATPVSKGEVGHDHSHEHAHEEHGPNGGHIIEFGKYHGEVAMSPTREIAVYILGDDAKTATPVEGAIVKLILKADEKDVTLEAKPTPKEGETAEKCSKFVVAADAVPASIKDIEGIVGTVELKIGEETLPAKVEHDHDHDHDHAEEKPAK